MTSSALYSQINRLLAVVPRAPQTSEGSVTRNKRLESHAQDTQEKEMTKSREATKGGVMFRGEGWRKPLIFNLYERVEIWR